MPVPWASCLQAENFQLVYLFSQKISKIDTVVFVLFHTVELEVKKKLERHFLSVPTCMHGNAFSQWREILSPSDGFHFMHNLHASYTTPDFPESEPEPRPPSTR
jgi:hypothetical protein